MVQNPEDIQWDFQALMFLKSKIQISDKSIWLECPDPYNKCLYLCNKILISYLNSELVTFIVITIDAIEESVIHMIASGNKQVHVSNVNSA